MLFLLILTGICVVLAILNAYYISTWYKYVAINIAGFISVSAVGTLSFLTWLDERL